MTAEDDQKVPACPDLDVLLDEVEGHGVLRPARHDHVSPLLRGEAELLECGLDIITIIIIIIIIITIIIIVIMIIIIIITLTRSTYWLSTWLRSRPRSPRSRRTRLQEMVGD